MNSTRNFLPETSVHIVGASVFGLSTAIHLSLAGYKDITVFDRSATLPSPYAASNDLNKIIRAEYGVGHADDDFYTDLALKAIKAWKPENGIGDWGNSFQQVGYVRLASTEVKLSAIKRDMEYFSRPERPTQSSIETYDFAKLSLSHPADSASSSSAGGLWFPAGSFEALESPAAIHAAVPQLSKVDFGSEWQGYLNKHAGYALASEAIKLAYRRCLDLGVKFVLGKNGYITSIESDPACASKPITGLRAADGTLYSHAPDSKRLTILCLGAHLPRLLPSAATQVTAKAWSVAHLEIDHNEAQILKGIPVMNFSELGFWMEPLVITEDEGRKETVKTMPSPICGPNSTTGSKVETKPDAKSKYLLKLACHGAGWTNFEHLTSTAPGKDQSAETISCSVPPATTTPAGPPAVDEAQLRKLVKVSLPAALHDRPFTRKSICWCADTSSSDFVIDFVPGYEDLVVAGADSGHAFKFLPIAGEWVRDFVQAGQQEITRWRWKSDEDEKKNGTATVAWRGGVSRDLKDLDSL